MNDFKFDLRLRMPQRPVEEMEHEECEQCQQKHDPKEECEGTGYNHWQTSAYEVPQVEDSSYLKKALARFKRKQKAKSDAQN